MEPLPGPSGHDPEGKYTLSFYPDRPVFWDDNNTTLTSGPDNNARVKKLDTSSNEVFQGMLFKPETLAAHWDTPERHEAVNTIGEVSGPSLASTRHVSEIRDTIRKSRMPTSLIREIGNARMRISTPTTHRGSVGGKEWSSTRNVVDTRRLNITSDAPRPGTGGQYNFVHNTISMKDNSLSSWVMHELGHAVHDFSARTQTGYKDLQGNDLSDVYASKPYYNMRIRTHPVDSPRRLELGAIIDPYLEGTAEGISRRYATNHSSSLESISKTVYDDPKAMKERGLTWGGPSGHKVYLAARDRVATTGKIVLLNPDLFQGLNPPRFNNPENIDKAYEPFQSDTTLAKNQEAKYVIAHRLLSDPDYDERAGQGSRRVSEEPPLKQGRLF
jgi:hypothetical protein